VTTPALPAGDDVVEEEEEEVEEVMLASGAVEVADA